MIAIHSRDYSGGDCQLLPHSLQLSTCQTSTDVVANTVIISGGDQASLLPSDDMFGNTQD